MTGGVLFSLGYFIAAYAFSIRSIPLFYCGYGIIGGVGLGLGYVTPVATAAKWFPDKKGLITGMVVMGFGFGALIMSKILAPFFMSLTNDNLVHVFLYIGIIMLVATLPAGYHLVLPPQGYIPKGYSPHPIPTTLQIPSDAVSVKQCILSSRFIMMWIVFFFNINAGIMFISFQSPLLQDLMKMTMDPSTLNKPDVLAALAASGATLIALSSICNGLGRFVWGTISDKLGRVQVFRLILGDTVHRVYCTYVCHPSHRFQSAGLLCSSLLRRRFRINAVLCP